MAQTKAQYWHLDVWIKAAKANGIHLTGARFSIRTKEKLMVTSADGVVTEQQEKLVGDVYLLVATPLDVHWKRDGHAYVMGVRDSKYDINLSAYA